MRLSYNRNMPRTGLTASEIKEKAIDATIAKMRVVGFDKIRLTDVAKELGVSHAALYSHFKDKSALLDAVSERWLCQIDENLEEICRKSKDPIEKIQSWIITLHRAKAAKVLNDPELYKAFDLSTSILKPFVKRHVESLHRQLLGLVKEVIAKRRLRESDPEMMVQTLLESLVSFYHPKLVAQHIHEKREPILRLVLASVLKGLNLKA
jgi:AcrR family transcriptional regulator